MAQPLFLADVVQETAMPIRKRKKNRFTFIYIDTQSMYLVTKEVTSSLQLFIRQITEVSFEKATSFLN